MQIRKLAIGTLLAAGMLPASAQVAWPPIKQTNKPWARWWWEGSAVDTANLRSNMQDYAAAGLGGLEITPIYGVKGEEQKFIPFLTPKWMDMLAYSLQEAKKLGIGIDMANGTGWPFGGPWIKDKDASKTVQYKTFKLKGGEKLQEPVQLVQEGFVRTANTTSRKESEINRDIAINKDLQALALDQVRFSGKLDLQSLMAYSDKGQVIDLTKNVDAVGTLNWTAPEGNWNLYALFQGLHGKMVERAAPGGEGYAIDHFSADALHTFLRRFDTAFKGRDLYYLRALFNDSYEVDDARGQSNWTPGFFDIFQKRRGYDLRQQLPALFQQADPEKNRRVLYDYRATIDELILENFTREWKKWGAGKGKLIRNQSHGSPANLLDLYGAIDIPETEGNDVLRFKFATSTANVMGKPLVSSESATWLNEHFLNSWGDVKKIVDLFFLGGVNHIFYHGVNYSPKDATWPGWLFYAATHFNQANPQWKDFKALNDYVARTQSFLQAGKPNNDVLLYLPMVDKYMEPGNLMLQHFDGMEKNWEGSTFEHTAKSLEEGGYTFDFFSDRQLQQMKVAGGKLQTGGVTYQTILLPANTYLPLETLTKLLELVKGGAQLLVLNELPKDVPGLHQLEQRRNQMQRLLQQLRFTTKEGIQTAVLGQGSVIIGKDLNNLMSAGSIRKEELAEQGLQFVRRANSDGHTYFINNRKDQVFEGWVPLAVKAASVALFDAATGNKGLARTRIEGGKLQVWLQLLPHASTLIRTFNKTQADKPFPYIEQLGEAPVRITRWEVSFMSGGPVLPPPFTTTTLRSWTEEKDSSYQNFSGVARYRTVIPKPSGQVANYLLHLGHVDETATVYLNGKKMASLIGPYFYLVIPAQEMKASNELVIEVANLMANRIRYMDRNGIEWKKFYNINMSARIRTNLKNGVFDASGWEPQSSGLLGPVTLSPLK
ncbi:alpha-L-rhamnosidase [Cnuella takakiae]|uniref:Alpha-L-rhamnosidase n=1 Tax=Cnuella takakiae TaxID=1302690 RepID=A0A1M4URD7_9BACT|nr:glycosyl hydrolase [Cnuella takakiae]SHE59249.1 alpha-L-rhamnosidase [Cnuella takakiae]